MIRFEGDLGRIKAKALLAQAILGWVCRAG